MRVNAADKRTLFLTPQMDSYISSHSSISESIHEKIQRDQSDIDRKLAAARERFRKAKAEL